jgi:hypothetical protein
MKDKNQLEMRKSVLHKPYERQKYVRKKKKCPSFVE